MIRRLLAIATTVAMAAAAPLAVPALMSPAAAVGDVWNTIGGGAGYGGAPAGTPLPYVTSMEVDGSGNVYIGGTFVEVYNDDGTTVPARGLAKYTESTGTWTEIAGGISASNLGPENPVVAVIDMILDGTTLYVTGNFDTIGTTPAAGVAKIDLTGPTVDDLDGGLAGVGSLPPNGQALLKDGSDIYVGGDFDSAGSVTANGIAKWDGSSWSALGPGFDSGVLALARTTDGSIYAGGTFGQTSDNVTQLDNIAKWNGSTWSPVGVGLDGIVMDLATDGTNVYAGGLFTGVSGETVANSGGVARWDGSSWSALGTGLGLVGDMTQALLCASAFGSPQVMVNALDVSGTSVYVGGCFQSAGGTTVSNIAEWDSVSTTWSDMGGGLGGGLLNSLALGAYGTVAAIEAVGSDVYAGGAFVGTSLVPGTLLERRPAGLLARYGGAPASYPAAIASAVVSAFPDVNGGQSFTDPLPVAEGAVIALGWGVAGSPQPTLTYEWQVSATENGTFTPIPEAEVNSYLWSSIPASYASKYIRVKVTATNGGGSESVFSQPKEVQGTPATVTQPTIPAEITVRDAITVGGATTGGIPSPTVSYEWQASASQAAPDNQWSVVETTSSRSFTVPDSAYGLYLRVKATATNAFGTQSSTSSSVLVGGIAPAISALTISGTALPGQVVTAQPTVSGVPVPSLAYRWQRAAVGEPWADIPGEIQAAYTVTEDDRNLRLRVVVTATSGAGGPVTRAAVVRAGIAPEIASARVRDGRDGKPRAGDTLRLAYGDVTGDPEPDVALRWESSADGTTWSAIPGATERTFEVPVRLAGQRIRGVVIATNAAGVTERPTAPVTIKAIPLPSRVRDMTITVLDKRRIKVTWTPPRKPSRAPATSYLVAHRPTGVPPWELHGSTTRTSYVFEGRFKKGVRYSFRVIPVSVIGDGQRDFVRLRIE